MRRRGRPGTLAVAGICGAVLVSCSGGVTGSPERRAGCDAPAAVAALPGALAEASGIARDPRREDLFWLHNDSGNDPRLYAVDTSGRLEGSVAVAAPGSVDPEDIALAPCAESWCLYLGDIGDNEAVRSEIRVHRLPLPPLPGGAGGDGSSGAAEIAPERTWSLVYPDGPRDAESLVVDASRGELLIVTKGREGWVTLYVAGLADLDASGSGPATLRRVGDLALPSGTTSQYVTAADLSPDATRLAIRSYVTLFLYDWAGSEAFDTATMPLAASLLPALEPQGEGLAFAGEGPFLYLASETRDGRPPQLSRIRCQSD